MSWNESTPAADRIFGGLAYLIPLADGLVFGSFLFRQFPILATIFVPVSPILTLYNSVPFSGFAVFLALFLLVVRNDNISYFIRFNVLQAILFDIILIVCNLVLGILAQSISGNGLLLESLFNTIFLGMLACVGVAVYQAARGEFSEIPAISDAVKMQLPR